ncbi:MAG: hypothetical protein AB1746_14610 [Candidatus Zixiibacteriota bacterium]
MRRFLVYLFLVSIALLPASNLCNAGVDIGLSLDKDGLNSFYLAIGDHYRVPEKEVVVVRERNIPDEELPVVFYLAARTGVSPDAIIKLRLGGKSWMDITFQYGLTAEVFYVPVNGDPGPPYGNAYGHFKHHNRNEWGTIRLTDYDVVNMVNLKFISEHYGCTPDDVIKMRSKGSNFVNINAEVKKNKGQANKELAKNNKESKKENDKGKGKNK